MFVCKEQEERTMNLLGKKILRYDLETARCTRVGVLGL